MSRFVQRYDIKTFFLDRISKKLTIQNNYNSMVTFLDLPANKYLTNKIPIFYNNNTLLDF